MRTRQRLVAYTLVGLSYFFAVGSLLWFFVFLFTGSYEIFPLGWSEWQSLYFDAGLSLLFFLQHSGMIRRSFQRGFGRFAPPSYHRALYALASGITLTIVLVFWQASHIVVWSIDGVGAWTVRGLFAAAIVGFVWGMRALGSLDPLGTGAILNYLKERVCGSSALTIRGPYRFIRHPLYTLTLVTLWACPVVTLDRLLLATLWTVWIVVGTVLEERDLVSDFGQDYRHYQRRVPMLLPWRRGDW